MEKGEVFQKRVVRTKFDIYVFMTTIYIECLSFNKVSFLNY